MTLAYSPRSTLDAIQTTRRHQSGTVKVDVTLLVRALQAFVAVILGLGILRELVIAGIGTETVLKDLRHFALDAERSLPSWYESISMAASALLLGLIAALSRAVDRENTRHWAILAVIFILMSIDSSVSFHEVSVAPLRQAFQFSGALYFSWVVLATPLVIAVGMYFIPFLLRLPASSSIRFMIAGALFVGGALGTEFLCGYVATTFGMETALYKAVAAGEEILESIGLTLFVIALLRHLGDMVPLIKLDLRNDTP